jgi:cell division transport system ATP-binding protein
MGRSRAEARSLAWKSLKMVSLDHKLHDYPKRLSGGEKQRVAIARALTNDPLILLADEPTGNLDPELSLEIIRLFSHVNARGTTVIVATHDRELVKSVPARVVALEAGRLVDPRQLEAARRLS